MHQRRLICVEPTVAELRGMIRAQQDRLEQVASASLLGLFRSSMAPRWLLDGSSMADFLWMKVDKYLHVASKG